MVNYFMGMIIDNVDGATLENYINAAVRTGLGTDGTGAIPEVFADLFIAMPFSMLTGEVRVKLEWA